ncbi:MAG TPA: hypothetical protein VF779_09595 [Pyrinomonadaceae bacterium]
MRNFQPPLTIKLASIILLCFVTLFAASSIVSAQQKEKSAPPASQTLLTRTTTKHEARRFGYGSSLTIIGAPAGSIIIEAWNKSEVDITADIELHAATESDLALLSTINSFTVDEDANHIRVLTTGTHDKVFMKRVAKKFPKTLLNLPWKIDYRIRVPANCDIEIDAGRGPISLAGVEGAISMKALESDAVLTLTGGAVSATIGAGSVRVNLTTRSWRGAGALVELARGDLTIELPAGFNADINASILRSGQIESSYEGLVPQERTTFTPQSIRGRAGAGGATLTFRVTDGTLKILKAVTSDK